MWSLLFPGQGSQHPGMGKFLFDNFKIAQMVFEEASDTLAIDLKKLCFEGSEQELALTENTQPCLLTVSTATHLVIKEKLGIKPTAAAGHSIGEYAALVAAQALDFSPALKAVRIRGQAMQSAVPVGKGAMAAVMGLENEQVAQLCALAVSKTGKGPLSPANFNSPGQVVISGTAETVEWLKTEFKPEMLGPEIKRVKLIPLAVSAPFHCDLMKPAEEKMREVLNAIQFKDSVFPIVQNFTAQPVSLAADLRENLIRQVSAPVLWTQCVLKMKEMGIQQGIELGAGKVISGLVKKIDSEQFKVFNVNSLEDIETLEKSLKA